MQRLKNRDTVSILNEGMLIPRSWLRKRNLSRHAIDNLIKSEQLELISTGVYSRPPVELTWQSVVCSLQTFFESDLVVGGITALELQGFGHYVDMINQVDVHLYGSKPLPVWLNGLITGVNFIYHSNTELLGKRKKIWNGKDLLRFVKMHYWRDHRLSLIVSSPERAIMEVLVLVPEKISFEHADQLMQSMTTLSPDKLQALLENCNNIKLRRLFFFLAERQNYSWLNHINRSKIGMGTGKRVLEKHGRLDKKYSITVPKSL